jgi:hypothetical protein
MRITAVALLAALVFAATPALADSSGPAEGWNGVNYGNVKSPPLQNSQMWSTDWAMHITFAFTNYAGFLFDLHYDGNETSFVKLTPLAPHVALESPFMPGLHPALSFPGSQSSIQVISPIALWIDPVLAQQSGMLVESSVGYPLFSISGHAKNTTPLNNSDIDVRVSAWQILHIVQSATYHLGSSTWVYLNPGGGWASQPGQGRWYHWTDSSANVFIPRSAFVATNNFITNTGGFGIEHVPEPAAGVMMLVGVGIAALARRRASS